MKRILQACAIVMLTICQVWGQTPLLTEGSPAESFINEVFCYPVTIENTGPNTGYGPYIRLILPPGMTFNGATYLGNSVTVTTVGVFAGSPLADPNLSTGTALDSVSGPIGHTFLILGLPVGSITTGGAVLNIDICFLMDPATITVGTPQDISQTTVYQFGDTPTGVNGPIIGSEVVSTIVPTLYTYEKRNDAPKHDRTPGPDWPITYTLEVDIANGMTITNLVFNDTLPGTLQWTGGPISVTGGCTVVQSPNTAPTTGGTIQVTCPSETGVLGGGDVVVEYEAYIIDTLDETIGDGGTCDIEEIVNTSSFNSTEGVLEVNNDTVTAYNITQQHSANPVLTAPGATVNYTINYQVSDYVTSVDSFVITVVVADGLTYLGNATINGSPIVANSVLNNTPGPGQTTVTYFGTSAIGNLSPGDGGTLTYECLVNQSYVATGDPILTRDNLINSSTVDYHLTDEPGLNGCSYDCATRIEILPVSLTKTIPSGITNYVPGDQVHSRPY